MENEIVEVLDNMDNKKSHKGLIITIVVIILIAISVFATIIVMNAIKPKIYSIDNLNEVLGESKDITYHNKTIIEDLKCNIRVDSTNKNINSCYKELFSKESKNIAVVYQYESDFNDYRIEQLKNNNEVFYKVDDDKSLLSVGLLENDDEVYFIIEESNIQGKSLKIINDKGETLKYLTNIKKDNYYTSYEIIYSKNNNIENAYITYFNCDYKEDELTQSVYNIKTNKEVEILKIKNVSCRDNINK